MKNINNNIVGYIEGFYGKLLSWNDRINIVNCLSKNKMNTYFYAPKEDINHRRHKRFRRHIPIHTGQLRQTWGQDKICRLDKQQTFKSKSRLPWIWDQQGRSAQLDSFSMGGMGQISICTMPTKKETFCVAPWYSLYIDSDKTITPCCKIKNNRKYTYKQLEEYFNSSELKVCVKTC